MARRKLEDLWGLDIGDYGASLKQEIARTAIDRQEDISTVLWYIMKELAQTNWQQVQDEDTEMCRCCKTATRYCDLAVTLDLYGNYLCPSCASHQEERQCERCHCRFPFPVSLYGRVCYECTHKRCCLCGEQADILCTSCMSKYQIQTTTMDRELIRINGAATRARDNGMRPSLDLRQWFQTLAFFNWLCAYCQTQPYTVLEHFIPVNLKGNTSQSNCVPSCTGCNHKKGHAHPNEVTRIPRTDIERVRSYLTRAK